MYQSRGMGALWGPSYVMGFDGKTIVDCSGTAQFFNLNCLNPFAKHYSMLDYTTQSDLGPSATPATVAAAAADTQATIQQQCADDPADCAIAGSDYPYVASVGAGAAQAAADAAQAAADAAGAAAAGITSVIPTWLMVVLIGGGALLVLKVARG